MDVVLGTQRGSSLITYLLLLIAYLTLLGVMLMPAHRPALGVLGTALLVGILLFQRLGLVRRANRPLTAPSAILATVGPRLTSSPTAPQLAPAPNADEAGRTGRVLKAGSRQDRGRT